MNDWPTECQDPWPKARPGWEPGLREVCDCREGDSIHGPASECDVSPCPNPAAHHPFVGAVAEKMQEVGG